jgi:hypothetical protein
MWGDRAKESSDRLSVVSYRRTVPKEVRVTVDLKSLARLGAQARLEQMDMERRAIHAAFPDLRTAAAHQARHAKRTAKASTLPPTKPARNVHRMSPAGRRAMFLRMKKYWAKRRKAKAGKKR